MKIAGYLIVTTGGIIGESGQGYDYIMAGNGIFLSARNTHFGALINIAPLEIRGLATIEEKITLVHGKIPRRFYELALSACLIRPLQERYIAVTWENAEYHINYPEQTGSAASIEYYVPANITLDIHSHGQMPAFFSGTDDRDDQGFRLSLVLGKVDRVPEYKLRLSVYGYRKELNFEEVFEGCGNSIINSPGEETATHGQRMSLDAGEPADTSPKGLPVSFLKMFKSFLLTWTGWKNAT